MMKRQDLVSPLRSQCLSLPDLCDPQIEGILRGLRDVYSADDLKKIKRVVVTGCGDSYVAAKIGADAFHHYMPGLKIDWDRAIHVGRYIDLDCCPENTLVIAVSASGGPARIEEVLRRGNLHGCMTLAVTNNPGSVAGQTAKRSLIVNTPEFPNAHPGLRNYYASVMGLQLFAAHMAEVTGAASAGAVDALCAAIHTFTADYAAAMEAIDDQMYDLAKTWKDCEHFDYIGDGVEFATAFFCGAKVVEVAGAMTSWDDSEDWCHVGHLCVNPGSIGTMFVADKFANDRTRVGETIERAASDGRPVLLVSNGTAADFGVTAGIDACTCPAAPEGFGFLLPLLDYVPGSILAAYIADFRNEPYFRGGGVWFDPTVGTIKSSKIVEI